MAQRQPESAPSGTDELYRLLAENVRDHAVLAFDPQRRIQAWPSAAERMFGYRAEEMIGQSADALSTPEDAAAGVPEREQQQAAASGRSEQDRWHVRRDGSRFWGTSTVTPQWDEQGGLRGFAQIVRDHTARLQRERAEQSLRESEARFRGLMEQAPFSIQIFSPGGEAVQVNRAWERLWGVTFGEAAGYNVLEDPQLQAKGVGQLLQRAFTGETVALPAIEYDPHETVPEQIQPGVASKWVSAVAYPLRDAGGEIREIVLVHHDITAQKRAEEALRASEERFRGIVSRSIAGVVEVDLEGRILFANQRYCEIVGRPLEELRRRTMQQITHPDDLPKNLPLFEQIARDDQPYVIEKRYIRPDGSHIWVNNSVSGLRGADGRTKSIVAVCVDVTDRRDAENSLRAAHRELEQRVAARTAELSHTNRFLRALLESIHDGIIACDADGELTFFNRAAALLHGLPRHPAARGDRSIAGHFHHPDGHRLDRADAPLFRALRGETIDSAEVLLAPKHGPARTLLASGRPFFDHQGNKLGAVVSMRDITGRKEAETALRRAHEELECRVSQRTAELAQANEALVEADRRKDEFLAMLAHELRNPLAPIRSGLELLGLMQSGGDVVEMMQHQVDHLVRLVDDLLDVSRIMRGKIELRRQHVDLATIIERAVETVHPVIEARGHRLEIDLPPDAIMLWADPVRLSQVIGNLLNNAAKYTPQEGRISVTVRRADDVARIAVRDTGMGITADLLPHVFDLFHQGEKSIDRSDGGLGIGLTLVKNLITMHGGTVAVQSDGADCGSEFTLTLPVRTARSSSGGEAGSPAAQRTYRILVTDAHEPAAKMTTILLKRLGDHHVSVAHDGETAIERAKRDLPDIILLDTRFGGRDGRRLAQRLRQEPQREPRLIIGLNDPGAEADRQDAFRAGCDAHYGKPLGVDALKAILEHPRLTGD